MYRLVKGAGPAPTIEGGEVTVPNEEPLKRELADFVDAVRSKRRRSSRETRAAARWRWRSGSPRRWAGTRG